MHQINGKLDVEDVNVCCFKLMWLFEKILLMRKCQVLILVTFTTIKNQIIIQNDV